MRKAFVACAMLLGIVPISSWAQPAQSQEETDKQWQEWKDKALAADKARADELAAARKKRRSDPMAWVNTLDPLPQGEWQFRFVAGDGSAAVYSSNHQRSRVEQIVTVWFRNENAEPVTNAYSITYMSDVEKIQFDCANARLRLLSATFYAENNLAGKSQNVEQDLKATSWQSIAPGSSFEVNISWACTAPRGAVLK